MWVAATEISIFFSIKEPTLTCKHSEMLIRASCLMLLLTFAYTLLVFQELEEIRKCGMKNFRNIQVDEANLLTWQGLIVPVSIDGSLF